MCVRVRVCVYVCVSAAVALVHSARGGYGILFLFLAASLSGAEPASVNCALQWDTGLLSLWRIPASGPGPSVLMWSMSAYLVCVCSLVHVSGCSKTKQV